METIINLFTAAIQDLKNNDALILQNQTREESVNHRLACYLENRLNQFQRGSYCVDIEYDKHGDDKKENVYKKEFRPDIIIHRRMVDSHNYAYVEAKKNPKRSEIVEDEEKIELAIKPPFNYKWGIRVRYGNGFEKIRLKLFWLNKNSAVEKRDVEI